MATTSSANGTSDRQVTAIWDAPVRIVHWAMAGLIGFSWYSAENHLMDWHRWSGYAVFGLLFFRILWGFVGSSTARFAQFVKGPARISAYLAGRGPRHMVGHNPLGALSVLALLLLMVIQVVTGLFAVDVDGMESGPLSDRVSFEQGRWLAEVHHLSFTILQILVVLHIVAILFYLVWKRDNLIGPMITGGRRMAGAGMNRAPLWRMLLCAALAAGAVWMISRGLRA